MDGLISTTPYSHPVLNWVFDQTIRNHYLTTTDKDQALDCCVLSSEEVGQLKHYQIEPCCKNHRHIKFKKAIEQIESGSLEIVEDARTGHTCLTPAIQHYLAPRVSGGTIAVIQRVKMVPPLHVTPPLGER